MSRYIDAEKLKRDRASECLLKGEFNLLMALDLINAAPTSRAEEILRCQYCGAKMDKDETALLCITKEELNHLINDTVSYILKLENKGLTGDEYGYGSRKKLLEKLEQFENQHFPEDSECCN